MADLLRFHVRVYARPEVLTADRPRQLGPIQITPLLAAQSELLSSWPITFDEAAERLSQLPRMFLEPDGSFVWVAPSEPAWQIDGVLYDRGPKLAYVELRGSCEAGALNELLSALGWPHTPLVFELVNEAILLSEEDFRRVAIQPVGLPPQA
ncbi:MAG TPA: hypothetical protein VMP01_30100 [Pirellulaceae bacterium]|nr:hypothetical protein [Pirellulaceae bacterium]